MWLERHVKRCITRKTSVLDYPVTVVEETAHEGTI